MTKHLLQSIYENFLSRTGYGIVVGVEQEFYIGGEVSADLVASINSKLSAVPFFSPLEEEKGQGQYEVQIMPTDNPVVMADMVMVLRRSLEAGDSKSNLQSPNLQPPISKHISFHAKPYPDQPGSGMHIHVNLIDKLGRNLFMRNGEQESELLNQSIAGLLELLPASMKYFAPYEEAYIRYTEISMNSPSTISWGADNRTVSLRLPSVPVTQHMRRIEHRVPAADADPYLAIAAILLGIEYGLVNKLINKHPKIWGNAFLPQYNLPRIPESLQEAENISQEYLSVLS